MSADINNLRFYDLLSALCYNISELSIEESRDLYQTYDNKRKKAKAKVKEILALENPLPYNLSNSELLHDAACKLLSLVEEDADGKYYALAGIEIIDNCIEYKNINIESADCCPIFNTSGERLCASHFFKQTNPLNPGSSKKWGSILPRFKSNWDKASDITQETVSENPLSVMVNYLWIPPKNDFTTHNLFLESFPAQKSLLILGTPVTYKAPFVAYPNIVEHTLEIEYYDKTEIEIEQNIANITKQIINEGVDIAVFPEMLGTKNSATIVSQIIRDNWMKSAPLLTLLPTREYKKDELGNVVNELVALDRDGDVVFKYNKQFPFEYKIDVQNSDEKARIKLFEPIKPDGMIFVIHIPNIGRVGVLICSDIFDEKLVELLFMRYRITLLLHPVCSFGDDSLTRSYSEALKYRCDALQCNTCAAYDEFSIPVEKRCYGEINTTNVYKYYPFGHQKLSILCAEGHCNSAACRGCYYIFEVPPDYKKEVKLLKHEKI